MSTDTAPLLSVRDVTVERGGKTILDHVSFDVRAGEWLGVIGPNGSGKTTLLRVVSGAMDACGSVDLKGRTIDTWGARERAQTLAFVQQSTGTAFDFTVRDLVLLGRAPHRGWLSSFSASDRAAVDRALAEVDLEGFADRSIQSMSGGEVQRAFLAQALAQDADLLLLDEPTTHLDVHYQFRLLDAVRAQVNQGKTVLAVVHDLESAARYADRLLVLSEGKRVATGEPASVLTPECIREVFGMEATVRQDNPLRIDYSTPRSRG
ncbi:ABC transporter [Longibacter salinarum]|uniref:ABC transporter n=1 Tax=Longibacter salinarum TaxID=1850348 RepID=A0A2A8D279_9BACT|nr:ABC transporter ATP-binding protein [Longibacter salinarum]PEN14917.1 ABC transporter [Longibacter salinarum]